VLDLRHAVGDQRTQGARVAGQLHVAVDRSPARPSRTTAATTTTQIATSPVTRTASAGVRDAIQASAQCTVTAKPTTACSLPGEDSVGQQDEQDPAPASGHRIDGEIAMVQVQPPHRVRRGCAWR
jgi:hypothetical protein